jgi:hypothetical protein
MVALLPGLPASMSHYVLDPRSLETNQGWWRPGDDGFFLTNASVVCRPTYANRQTDWCWARHGLIFMMVVATDEFHGAVFDGNCWDL